MGLFDKKYCDFCGNKIGLLGNRKLEDGNMCKDCAKKLSPWFSERRHSTKNDITEQLAYREENKKEVAAFHTTRSIGKNYKLLIDEDRQKFMVTNASNLESANPDVLNYSQVTGCNLDIEEHRSEIMRKDKDGNSISYNPRRYEYSYEFYVTIFVNHPYFDEMRFELSNGYVHTGEQAMTGAHSGWNITRRGSFGNYGSTEYNEYLNMGNEIKEVLDEMRQGTRDAAAAQSRPKTAVTCPYCGATTIPDANGCCEFCGGAVNG